MQIYICFQEDNLSESLQKIYLAYNQMNVAQADLSSDLVTVIEAVMGAVLSIKTTNKETLRAEVCLKGQWHYQKHKN